MLLLFLTLSVLVARPRKLLHTVANPACGLLNRGMYTCHVYSLIAGYGSNAGEVANAAFGQLDREKN